MYDMGVPTKAAKKIYARVENENRKKRKRVREIAGFIKFMPDMPNCVDEWARTLFDNIMLYRKTGAKTAEGHCECGAVVDIKPMRSGSNITCPVCGKTVRVTHTKRNGTVQYRIIAYVDKLFDGWVCRYAIYTKDNYFGGGNVHVPYVSYGRQEEQRDFIDKTGDIRSFHTIFGRDEVWREGRGRMHGQGWSGWRIDGWENIITYPHNLNRLFKNSPFQYSAIDIATEKSKINPVWYLQRYMRYPQLEMLYKLGLIAVAEELCNKSGWIRSDTDEILKCKTLKDFGIDTAAEIKECAHLGIHDLIARKEVKGWRLQEAQRVMAIEFVKKLNRRCGDDMVYDFMSRRQWFNYYLKQQADFSEVGNFISDYTDYVSDCVRLQLDLKDTAISRPKSLKTAHKWTVAELKILENHVYDALIEAAYSALRDLVQWGDGTYEMLMPRTAREIVEEGTRQSHCVGRYCERMAKGESVILFLRRSSAPDEGFYTVEIKRDMQHCDIVQCRGYGNEDPSPEIRAEVDRFLAKYAKWFERRPLNGYTPDEQYVKYYKAVHKSSSGKYTSNFDTQCEFKIGEWQEWDTEKDPDKVYVKGMHVASMEFAQGFGDSWKDVAILEIETNIHDVIIPDAKDQVRTSKFRVVREVPMSEMGEWGARHIRRAA